MFGGWFSNSAFHSARVTRGAERAAPIVELKEIPTWPETFRRLQRDDDDSDSDSSVASRSSRSSRSSARSSASKGGKPKNGKNSNGSDSKTKAAAPVEAIDEVEESKNESAMQDVEQAPAAAAAAFSSSSDYDPSSAAAAAAASSSFVAAAAAAPAPVPLPAELPEDPRARFALYEQAFLPNATFNRKIRLYRGDITKLRVDAVCNAANSGLHGGGGICGAIFDAAGDWKLSNACKRIRNEAGPCPPGETRLTRGFALPAPYILHTVGPMDGDEDDLISAYTSALDMCISPVLLDQKPSENIQIRSLALCCISTGIYGFPNDDAAEVALRSTREWLEDDPARASAIDAIVFCVFLAKDLNLYERMLPAFFPVGKDELEALAIKEAADKAAAEKEAEERKLKQQNQKQSKQHGSPAKSPRGAAAAAAASPASKASSKASSPSSAVAARVPLPTSPSPSPPAAAATGAKASPSQSRASAASSSAAAAAASASGSPILSSPPPPQLKKRKSEEEAESNGKQQQQQKQPQVARPPQSHNAKSVVAAQARAEAHAKLFKKQPLPSSHQPSRPSSSSSHAANLSAMYDFDAAIAASLEESKQQPVHKPQPQPPRRTVFAVSDDEEEDIFADFKEPAGASFSPPPHQAKKTKHQG